MQEMSPNEVHEYLSQTDNKPLLLDVRESWEYDICHIKGSKHIPMQTIANEIDHLDPEQEIIVVCHHGIRSRMVAQFLEQEKFKNITNLSGGVAAWSQLVDRSMPTYL